MKRKRRANPMPIGAAVFFIIVGMVMGTVFTLGMQYWNEPIQREDARVIVATYDSYYRDKSPHHDRGITVRFTDRDQLTIDSACLRQDVVDSIQELSSGDRVELLVHPNSDTIWEMKSDMNTILPFELAQERLTGENIAFGILGILLYALAVSGVVSLLFRWRRAKTKKKKKRKLTK